LEKVRYYPNMIEEIANLVESACKSENNVFGYRAWTYHIQSVVRWGDELAKKFDGDREVVHIAALLHDYSGILNKEWYPEHHIESARLTDDLLVGYKYPKEKIELVKECILCHRGSVKKEKGPIEAKILASADAMAHIDNVPSLLYLAYVEYEKGTGEGAAWVLAKIERSWQKLMPEAKEMVREQYAAARIVLGNKKTAL